jgi:hypothetical protein
MPAYSLLYPDGNREADEVLEERRSNSDHDRLEMVITTLWNG